LPESAPQFELIRIQDQNFGLEFCSIGKAAKGDHMRAIILMAISLLSVSSFAKDEIPQKDVCVVSQTGEIVDSKEFFSKAVAHSNRNDTCTVANIYRRANSTRIYINGKRQLTSEGSLPITRIGERSLSNDAIYIPALGASCYLYTCIEKTNLELYREAFLR
jgi:hypothetical protein